MSVFINTGAGVPFGSQLGGFPGAGTPTQFNSALGGLPGQVPGQLPGQLPGSLPHPTRGHSEHMAHHEHPHHKSGQGRMGGKSGSPPQGLPGYAGANPQACGAQGALGQQAALGQQGGLQGQLGQVLTNAGLPQSALASVLPQLMNILGPLLGQAGGGAYGSPVGYGGGYPGAGLPGGECGCEPGLGGLAGGFPGSGFPGAGGPGGFGFGSGVGFGGYPQGGPVPFGAPGFQAAAFGDLRGSDKKEYRLGLRDGYNMGVNSLYNNPNFRLPYGGINAYGPPSPIRYGQYGQQPFGQTYNVPSGNGNVTINVLDQERAALEHARAA